MDGSPADRCGHLNVGDRILAVNQTEISQLHHSQVVQLIKDSGLMLTLSVLPVQIDPNGGGMHHPQQQQQQQTSSQLSPINHNNMMTTDMENFTLKDNNLGYDMGTAFINPESQPVHFGSKYVNIMLRNITLVYFAITKYFSQPQWFLVPHGQQWG